MHLNSKDKPFVSIITPSFNQGCYIEENILSVIHQDYPNLEHIIIDGGSKDETLSILKKYEKSCKWISEPDKGQSDALNKGFKISGGSIIGWLNSDDFYLPGAINTMVDFFQKNPDVDMVYGDCNYQYDNGADKTIQKFISREFNLDELINDHCYIAQQSTFFRRQALFDAGLVDTSLHYAMDYDLWIKMSKSKKKIQYLPVNLAVFRLTDSSKSGTTPERFWHETRKVSLRYRGSYFSPMYHRHCSEKLREKMPFLHMFLKKILGSLRSD